MVIERNRGGTKTSACRKQAHDGSGKSHSHPALRMYRNRFELQVGQMSMDGDAWQRARAVRVRGAFRRHPPEPLKIQIKWRFCSRAAQ